MDLTVRTEVREYIVTAWPEDLADDCDARHWEISVHRTRIPDMWAVTRQGNVILTKKGNWSPKMPRNLRSSCYMPLQEALTAAAQAAPMLRLGGWTLQDMVDGARARLEAEGPPTVR